MSERKWPLYYQNYYSFNLLWNSKWLSFFKVYHVIKTVTHFIYYEIVSDWDFLSLSWD